MKSIAISFLVAHLCFQIDVGVGVELENSDTEATINLRGRKEFRNWGSTAGVGGTYEKMFTPRNGVSGTMQNTDFLTGLQQIKNAVAEAAAAGKQLRAFGSAFSMINVQYTKEYLLDSRELNYYKIGIDADEHVAPSYSAKKQQLVFVQSGIMIRELNLKLLDAGLALPSSSKPDGTRFVGAISTASHGSQRSVGGMENYVKAIHLVIPGDSVIVQQESDQVVTAAYAQYMGDSRLVNDDNLFRAALVSFGNFGVIHGVVFEAGPLFQVKYRTELYDYEITKSAMTTHNVSMLKGMEQISDQPFHIDFHINPYRLKNKGVSIRLQDKIIPDNEKLEQATLLVSDAHEIPQDQEMQIQLRRFHLLSTRFLLKPVKRFVMGMLLQIVVKASSIRRLNGKTLYPHQVNTIVGTQKRKAPLFLRGYYETEISVPFEKTIEAIDMILKMLDGDPLPIFIGVRSVKKSIATIAMTRFEMTTSLSVMAISYENLLYSKRIEAKFQQLYKEFDAKRNEIPHTYHWGKRFPINDWWVGNAYGESIVNWKAEREAFLGANGLRMFTNELMQSINATF